MRIRTIKPEFFLHEGLFEAEMESKMPLRVAFAGLWCAADREGRFKWEPRRLGVSILPYDEVAFSRVLDALKSRGFVVQYASDGENFGLIPTFKKHQVINNKERQSELPKPSVGGTPDAIGMREPRVDDAIPKEGNGREQGREGIPPTPKPETRKTPTLDEVIAFAAEPQVGIPADVAEIWWNEQESRPFSPAGNYTDKLRCEVGNWRAALRGYALKWRANDNERKINGNAQKPTPQSSRQSTQIGHPDRYASKALIQGGKRPQVSEPVQAPPNPGAGNDADGDGQVPGGDV